MEVVEAVLGVDATALAPDFRAVAPLHLIARMRWSPIPELRKQQWEVTKILLRSGHDVRAVNHEKETALHLAAWRSHDGMVRLLIQGGADVHAQDKTGNTPLHRHSAIPMSTGSPREMEASMECVDALLKAGAKVDTKNAAGKTPLDMERSDVIRSVLSIPEDQRKPGSLLRL